MNTLKKIILNFSVILISFLLIEIFTRVIIFFPTNSKIFKFGFDKNIIIEIVDLSKLQINITDRQSYRSKEKIIKKTENDTIDIWTFGGSTTYGNNCGESSSWVDELQKKNNKINLKNFAFNGADSDQQVAILNININKKKIPDIILWASKFNMTNILTKSNYRNHKILKHKFRDVEKHKKFLYIKRVDKTLKSYLISYTLMDAIILRLFPSKIKYTKKTLSDIDVKMMVKNFHINTNEAIEISKSRGVKEFYLISLFSDGNETKKNNLNLKTILYNSYLEDLTNKHANYVKIIDLTDYLSIENKDIFLCDAMHQTLEGNIFQADIINNFLVNNSISLK